MSIKESQGWPGKCEHDQVCWRHRKIKRSGYQIHFYEKVDDDDEKKKINWLKIS